MVEGVTGGGAAAGAVAFEEEEAGLAARRHVQAGAQMVRQTSHDSRVRTWATGDGSPDWPVRLAKVHRRRGMVPRQQGAQPAGPQPPPQRLPNRLRENFAIEMRSREAQRNHIQKDIGRRAVGTKQSVSHHGLELYGTYVRKTT